MDLSIIIVSFNTKKLLEDCVDSIIKNTKGIKYEIIVVDNASADGSPELVERYSRKISVRLIKNRNNLGFGTANNQGMKKSSADFVLLLNSDTIIHDNAISHMLAWMKKKPKVGISTCALKNADGSLQGTGGHFPTLIRVFSWMTIQDLPLVDKFIKPFHPMREKSFSKGEDFYNKEKEMDWVTAAFFMIRREAMADIGYFDEDYFMYTEETDYCYRAKKKGWKVWYVPKWSITHLGGASGTSELSVLAEFEGVKTFYKKHYPAWQYMILRLFLKIGAFGRVVLFGILEGSKSAKIYAEAFKKA
jgi:GT2 family glycosyltransferase